ncbi:MAG: fasciclin domain-containing protein [Bacteroidaceae bacterium]|nr:fasciclin domain-containing protein [Bacteroidaceae bacterium]
MKKYILSLTTIILLLCSCTEDIDTSARYVFSEETILSYLQKHDDYSEYVRILRQVPISSRSKSTVFQLLSARGNYTCFAPTNDAIALYLQDQVEAGYIEEPTWESFKTDKLRDSIMRVIVYNSIIDGGDYEFYMTMNFPQNNNDEFGRPNMNDLRLSVYRPKDPDSIYINRIYPINLLNRDIPAINGVIHQMEKVIAPREVTLKTILQEQLEREASGFVVMARIIQACGLMDTLSKIRDEVYESLYQTEMIEERTPANGLATMDGGYSYAPEHRKYGFTIFAEKDDFWQEAIGKPAEEITPEDVQAWVEAGNYYPEAVANTNFKSPDNLLYQWTTYHVLPFKLAPDRLVFHYNEKGYDYVASPGRLSIPVMEYYVTMGKRRLLKIFESMESQGVYLNRFPTLDNGRHGTGHETGCDPDKVGARVMKEDINLDKRTALNGYIYEINAPIAYDETTRNNLARTRIRMDCMSFFPEVMNNDIRRVPLTDARHQWVHFPDDAEYKYIGNLSINEGSTFVYYNAHNYKFGSLCGDEVKCVGRWELVFTLPPVPKRGTYEVRYRILTNSDRGVAQFFFGDRLDAMPAAGIPVNLTLGGADPITGWIEDTGTDEDADAEADKQMRNCGFMKGEESILILKNPGTTARANVNRNIVRRIITRQTLDPDKTYYLKIKSVLDTERAEFYMDHIEYCPKEIYDNPEHPEDIW